MKPPSTAVSVSGPFDQQRQHQPIPTDFSSDGKYLVFQQNDPKTTGDLQVVALDEDGRELFYMTGNGPTAIMAVPVELGANFVAGTPSTPVRRHLFHRECRTDVRCLPGRQAFPDDQNRHDVGKFISALTAGIRQ